MDSLALGARVLLAIVFATAAVAKLADQPGARLALQGFGMPERWLVPLAVLLPVAELGTAAGLLVQLSARWAAIAALGLLLVFVAGIANAMARGREPECRCFGQLSSARVGRSTLIRNALLAVPAAIVAAHGPGEAIDIWLAARSPAELAALGIGAAAVVLAAVCERLWSDNSGLRRDLARARGVLDAFPAQGLPIGAPAPRFALPTLDGHTITLDSLLERGKPVALVFLSLSCPSCDPMLPELARWERALEDRLTIAVLESGNEREVRRSVEPHGLKHVLVERDDEVFEAYRTISTPSGVIVTPDGKIGSHTSTTKILVEALIRRALLTTTVTTFRSSVASDGEPLVVQERSGAGASR